MAFEGTPGLVKKNPNQWVVRAYRKKRDGSRGAFVREFGTFSDEESARMEMTKNRVSGEYPNLDWEVVDKNPTTEDIDAEGGMVENPRRRAKKSAIEPPSLYFWYRTGLLEYAPLTKANDDDAKRNMDMILVETDPDGSKHYDVRKVFHTFTVLNDRGKRVTIGDISHMGKGGKEISVTKNPALDFPTAVEVSKVLKDLHREAKADIDAEEGLDVRLQVYENGTWAVRYGDPGGDSDHHGYWGASTITRSDNDFRSIAVDLIAQAEDQYEESQS
jgi:hypothetical protein